MDGDEDGASDHAGSGQVPAFNDQFGRGGREGYREDKSSPDRSVSGMKRIVFCLLSFSCPSPLQAQDVLNNPTRDLTATFTPSLRASRSRSLAGTPASCSLEVRQELLTGSGLASSNSAEYGRVPGSQLVVSEDETLIVAIDSTNGELLTWSNTGYAANDTCPGGFPGIVSGDGSVCCDIGCGQCGGTGCNNLPGGSGNCCVDGQHGILTNSDDCSVIGSAPCVVGDGQYAWTDIDDSAGDYAYGLMIQPGLPRIIYFGVYNGGDFAGVHIYDESDASHALEKEGGLGAEHLTGSATEQDDVVKSAITVNLAGGTYLGCYQDSSSSRIMAADYVQEDGMTTQMCREYCHSHEFFGTQYSKQCFCGDISTNYAQHGESTGCSMTCDGDEDGVEICGGNGAMSVYRIRDIYVIALVGANGGVRRLTVDADGEFGTPWAFTSFEKYGSYDATAIAFSPDGSTLYIATEYWICSTSSHGYRIPDWWESVADADLCDMAISPDGLSVYVLGCASDHIFHITLDAANGEATGTFTYSTSSSDVGGSDSTAIFRIAVLQYAVVAVRNASDEIVMYERVASTGVLSSTTTTRLNNETVVGTGSIVGMTHSDTALFVSMAAASAADSRIVVVDFDCGWTPAPTVSPTPAPTPPPSLAPTTAPTPSQEWCRLELAQNALVGSNNSFDTSRYRRTPGSQLLISQDETLIVGTDYSFSELLSWSNTGYTGLAGQYAWTDLRYVPLGAAPGWAFLGLILQPGLPRIIAFDHVVDDSDSGSDFAWVYIYDESKTNPLEAENTGITSINGPDDQEDWVVEAAITADHAVATYLGCFMDSASARIMSAEFADESDMTTKRCQDLCAGYVFFGTEFQTQCFCGDSSTDFTNLGVDSLSCFMNCGGDSNETCGGNDIMSAYQSQNASLIALRGSNGGVRRLTVDADGGFGTTAALPDFEKDGVNDATAIAFSPDGSTLYIATNDQEVFATSSYGYRSPYWSETVSDADLCDMAVSQDGLSVYALGCASNSIIHLRLEATGEVAFTVTYSTSDAGGSGSDPMLRIEVLQYAVVAARSASDELVIFERESSTGRLFWPTTTNLGDAAFGGTGEIAGMTHSNTTLFVSVASSSAASYLQVLDFACDWTPSPVVAPVPAPTLAPSEPPIPLAPTTAPSQPPTPPPTLAPTAGPTPEEWCSLLIEQEAAQDPVPSSGQNFVMGSQIVVSRDETLVMTVDATNMHIMSWANTGPATKIGRYTLTDVDSAPLRSEELRGLMLHPGLPTIYAFSHDPGDDDEVFIFEYDFDDGSYPLSHSSSSFFALVDGDAGQQQADAIVESAISTTGLVAILGEQGGVRHFNLNGVGGFGPFTRYNNFGKDGGHDGTALVFSPDGSIIYIATDAETVLAFGSTYVNSDPPIWSAAVGDSNLCDIIVSPDGLSVYAMGCSSSTIFHLQLDETTGEVASTVNYTADSSIIGSQSGGIFVATAVERAVLVGRPDSDEIVVFQRDTSTGSLHSPRTVKVGREADRIGGVIAAMTQSTNASSSRLFVSMAATYGEGGIAVFSLACSLGSTTTVPSPAPTQAPAVSPSRSPFAVSTPAPTVLLSTVPELVEARLAAAVNGIDVSFQPGRRSSGLWCHGVTCSESTCNIDELFDSATAASVGTGAFCTWKDDTTVLVTFGRGYTLAENNTVTLNEDSKYMSGCATCVDYPSGSVIVQARIRPPQLSSARFTDTGAQVMVDFTGSPSSQEINGTFDAVSCDLVFSSASVSTLGLGHVCQFISGSSLKVTLGSLSSIAPSSRGSCTDGDGTSLTLLAGVVRTEIGAFLTSSAGCVVVEYPARPDPPYVVISAPSAIGYCDDLILEGSATISSIGGTNITWEVAAVGGDLSADISNVSRTLSEAGTAKHLTVTIPSDHLEQHSTFSFLLRVDTALGGSSEATVEVYKSSVGLLVSKVLGSSVLERTRGTQITIRSETRLSSCSKLRAEEAVASYSWNLVAANESYPREQEVTVEVGRDPRVLVIPSHTLGYAGSSYLFQLRTTYGSETANAANVTVKVVDGAIVAAISGGTRRTLGVWQALQLDASATVDEDDLDIDFDFHWYCEDNAGGTCVSRTGETLDLSSFAGETILLLPAGSLPAGVEYIFTVTASKGFVGGTAWAQYRSDNASCVISTSALDSPHVSILPKEIHRKYNPSSRLVLYGCAAASLAHRCSNNTMAGFDFEWGQVASTIDVSDEGRLQTFRTLDSNPTLVVRAGALSPGRAYTFWMTATDYLGSTGYCEFSFETNAAPVGGYVDSDLREMTAGQDAVLLQTMAWTDDFDDLPLTYEFGYTHGWHEVSSPDGDLWITKLSTGASSSSVLLTHIPPGTVTKGFNITVVGYVSDILGSTAITSIGVDGMPLAIVSTPPEQVSVSSLLGNISSLLTGGASLVDPADALRNAITISAVLEYAPEPESEDELAEVLELKETIVLSIAKAYLALEPTATAAGVASEGLAGGVTSYAESAPMSNAVGTVVSGAAADMIEVSTRNGRVLESSSAGSLLQIVSVLLNESDTSSAGPDDVGFAGKNDTLALLGSLAHAVAIGAEAGEDIDEVDTGSIELQAAKVAESSIPETMVMVGEKGVYVSFEDWVVPVDVEDNSTIVTAVTTLGISESEGLEGVTAINVWGEASTAMHELPSPVKFSINREVKARTWSAASVTPSCVFWSEPSNEWRVDGVVLDGFSLELDGTSTITCSTFHLSPFAITEETTEPVEWSSISFLGETDVLLKYGAESWPAIFFLCLVVAVFLIPAMLLHQKDVKHNQSVQYLEILRSSYLSMGRCSREDQPLVTLLREKARKAHEDVNTSNRLESGYVQVHKIASPKQKDHLAKTVVVSIFMNHAWSHLRSEPSAHFKRTLLTRSQHLVILLADWMSAVALQAVFYGKSQFSVREKAEMTAATALFMIPTALVFPALLRKANTPPPSGTLSRARKSTHKTGNRRTLFGGNRHGMSEYDRVLKEQHEDFHAALSAARARPRNPHRGSVQHTTVPPEPLPPTELRRPKPDTPEESVVATPRDVSANKTAVYRDIVALQRVMVGFYLFVPLWMAALVLMVTQQIRAAEVSPVGDQNALLHNVSASLGIIGALLCAVSAYGVAGHRVGIMSQAMAFQAIVAPALVLCGALLYGSNFVLATGAVIGGLWMLVCAYLLRLHRKNELAMQAVCQEDLITEWSHPSPAMQSAAILLQGKFRVWLAATRMTRALEFRTWLNECNRRRSMMYIVVNSAVFLTILCLTYTNLVFAIKFDRETCKDWLTTCVIALAVEAILQQPVVLLMTGVLGDYVEEGADFLLEVLDF